MSKDIKDQLTPIAATLRAGRSVIRPVSQIMLTLPAEPGKDRFAGAVDCILQWMNKRAGRSLPEAAWQRQSFELSDVGAQRTAAVFLKSPKYWAARLDDADKNVPMRTWVTEIGVGEANNGDVLFGARLICVTRGDDAPYSPSVPGFTKVILASGQAMLDGLPVQDKPRVLTKNDDVANLVRLLELPARHGNVIVFSLPEGSTNLSETAASVNEVMQGVKGIAHVFVITGPATFSLTNLVGRELSVFHQAVRIYRPGFKAWLGQPSDHPLIFPAKIREWSGIGSNEFEKWLIHQALFASVRGRQREEILPSFNQVRHLASQAERQDLKKSGGSDAEILQMFEQENQKLQTDLKEQKSQYDGLLTAAEEERDAAIQDANAAKAQSLERTHRIRLLEQRLSEVTGKTTEELPTTFDEIETWCKENLVGAVEMVGKAFQGIRKSNYHDPQFIYRVLLFLRDFYVPMRVETTTERRQAYEAALKELQLEESATGEGVKYAADTYSVQYGQNRKSLDRHLKGSSSRDRRYQFRCYFFWDEEGQVVVVGWLPSHLDNRAS